MEVSCKLGKGEKGSPIDKGQYRRLVRRLIYPSHIKQSINFSTSVVSKFVNDLRETHIRTIYKILKYTKLLGPILWKRFKLRGKFNH